jgi:predicted enzyme related to lactoylglutathione lyase
MRRAAEPNMSRVQGLQHVALRVSDIERSAAFYSAVFGGRVQT